MQSYNDITSAMRAVLMMYGRGYTQHIRFKTTQEKLQKLEEKWITDFGTRLPAHTRFARKQRGHANAVAYSAPVLGEINTVEVILMATNDAKKMPEASPWARENWSERYPEFSKFVMIKEQRERFNGVANDDALTWRVKDQELEEMRKYLVTLASVGNGGTLKRQTEQIIRIYPMFGGVRRQIRRMFREVKRLWQHLHKKQPWPCIDPEELPMNVGFKSLKTAEIQSVLQKQKTTQKTTQSQINL